MTDNKNKISICFVAPIAIGASPKETRAAYKELHRQIVQFANAITRDPNAIIVHSSLTPNSESLDAALESPADSKIAELQSIATPREVDTPETPPKKRELPIPPVDEDEEKPHVIAGGWTPPEPSTPKPVTVTKDTIIDKIFENLKRSAKSVTIVEYLVVNAGKELTVDDLVKGTKLEKPQVANWLSQTGESITGLTKVKRGTYRFNA